MEIKQWGKLILSFYKYLESSINAIDKYVLNKCLNTSYYDKANPLNILKRVDKVNEFIDKKRRFLNLKVIIQDAIIKMPSKYQRQLVLEYFDGVCADEQANLFGVNVRTIFRYKKMALASFASALTRLGYNSQYFQENYNNEVELFTSFGEYNKNIEKDFTNFRLAKELLDEYVV